MTDIKKIHVESIEPYSGPHAIEKIRFRPAAAALGVTAWGMNVLDLDAGADGYPEHDHVSDGQEEVYVVLSGSATLIAGDERHELVTGTMIRVGPDRTRKIVPGADGVRILAIGGTPGKAYAPA